MNVLSNTDLIVKILTIIGAPSLFLIINYVIKGISLVKTNSFERLLLADQKKMTAHFLEALFFSVFFGIIMFLVSLLIFGKDSGDPYFSAVFGFLMMMMISFLGSVLLYRTPKNNIHYIVENEEKLYIHKVTNEGDIILSEEKLLSTYSNIIVQKREYVYGKVIKVEHIDV